MSYPELSGGASKLELVKGRNLFENMRFFRLHRVINILLKLDCISPIHRVSLFNSDKSSVGLLIKIYTY